MESKKWKLYILFDGIFQTFSVITSTRYTDFVPDSGERMGDGGLVGVESDDDEDEEVTISMIETSRKESFPLSY